MELSQFGSASLLHSNWNWQFYNGSQRCARHKNKIKTTNSGLYKCAHSTC